MAGVVGKISCSKVRDLLRFPDFDDSNYLEKRKALVLHYTITRDEPTWRSRITPASMGNTDFLLK